MIWGVSHYFLGNTHILNNKPNKKTPWKLIPPTIFQRLDVAISFIGTDGITIQQNHLSSFSSADLQSWRCGHIELPGVGSLIFCYENPPFNGKSRRFRWNGLFWENPFRTFSGETRRENLWGVGVRLMSLWGVPWRKWSAQHVKKLSFLQYDDTPSLKDTYNIMKMEKTHRRYL